MNVLIINLTRFGDVIQTQPVISGFKSQGHRVGLVCLKNFASAATLLDGIDAVIPFSGAGVLAGLDSDWRLAVKDVSVLQSDVFALFKPDMTVNLTPSVSSRMLAYALTPETGQTVGFTVDEFGFNADSNSWAAFLQMAGANRGASPFNICDLFRRAVGLSGTEGNSLKLAAPADESLNEADALLANVSEGTGFIALQMGASEERRRWPVASFAAVARTLWERDGLAPVLLGTKGEVGLGDRFADSVDFPFVNCIGRTSLTALAGVLKRCKALITNDTGTMHLAAGLGVPLCAVFLATAQPWDTGPYRAGNICLEPDMACHPCEFGKQCPHDEQCRHAVTPEAMYSSVSTLLSGERRQPVSGARVWQSVTGGDGFMNLESLSGHDQTDRALWISIQRKYFSRFLDGLPLDEGSGLGRKIRPQMGEDIFKTLTSAHDMLFLISQQGTLLMQNPRPQAKAKFLASWQRLQTILSSNQHLNILALLWVFETQRFGDDLPSLLFLSERYRLLFAALRNEFAQ
ncbi:glycosyltransferase family 9 protein [Pseudodesulfovibrio sediminis]|uniref:Heptosyltransferase n=1 Tax=Pseudodesulfovibrio sediminis TaxID=2810563 RepID=A0ABM9SDU0_9BACT|nr:glycosyltransferase family 9 protein [Pseudodesulfovibrio sediminis]BCS87565.1 heptosyltransferase [Pseudodesulfovibrio sediminis]